MDVAASGPAKVQMSELLTPRLARVAPAPNSFPVPGTVGRRLPAAVLKSEFGLVVPWPGGHRLADHDQQMALAKPDRQAVERVEAFAGRQA